ncbi:MAG: replication-associated recombination protein A [Fimbriimonadaceae bacterium]|nr:replication-associated recombination protein A [Chitinophagales bacterium]
MLFDQIPLAERLRPKNLNEFIGQEHLVGDRQVLRKMIESRKIISMIFWGPPGVGKTTLANILANAVDLPFFSLSAVSAGVKDVREIIDKARRSGKIVLFIDEIHRFNKAQQDSLLGAVEKGLIVLIGATTENPSFEVISALLSRCQVYILKELSKEDLQKLIARAITEDEVLSKRKITVKEDEALLRLSGGDARKLLNLLELIDESVSGKEIIITDALVINLAQKKTALYDKDGELHYDIISAFIKSMRGSDPNAAMYYLARMIEGGEDPKFIARRMLILASEDIGNANPNALLIATNCFHAVTMIGYPECSLILSQVVIYLASSPKSNSATVALGKAMNLVKEMGDLSIPLAIRNAPTKLMKELNYGKDYQYAHEYEGNFINMEFLPDTINGTKFFEPGNNARENEMRKYLKEKWGNKYEY